MVKFNIYRVDHILSLFLSFHLPKTTGTFFKTRTIAVCFYKNLF